LKVFKSKIITHQNQYYFILNTFNRKGESIKISIPNIHILHKIIIYLKKIGRLIFFTMFFFSITRKTILKYFALIPCFLFKLINGSFKKIPFIYTHNLSNTLYFRF